MIYLFLLTLYFSQVQQLKSLSSWLVITDKVQSFAMFSPFYLNMMFNSNRCYLTRSIFSFSFVIKPGNFEWVVMKKCESMNEVALTRRCDKIWQVLGYLCNFRNHQFDFRYKSIDLFQNVSNCSFKWLANDIHLHWR